MRGIRGGTSAVITSVGLVVAVAVGVFASASFATEGLVSERSDLQADDVAQMAELRTRGGVKAVNKRGTVGYALDFTAIFTPPPDSKAHVGDNGGPPRLVMRQSVRFPTLSGNQEFVGPVGLPFASETLALDVIMNGDPERDGKCFTPSGKDSFRMKGLTEGCIQAFLSLGDESFEVTKLFIDLDSRLSKVGRDGETWMWRAKATFSDPGYAFPIVSLGEGGSTEVLIGDLYGSAEVGKVSFSGTG